MAMEEKTRHERNDRKRVVIFSLAFLIVAELIIYLSAAAMSGKEYRTIVEDQEGRIVYETTGKSLTKYEELSLENQMGSLANYRIRILSKEKPFPFRGWLAAAVGIPIGFILLLAFMIKGYFAIFERNSSSYNLLDMGSPPSLKSLFIKGNSFSIFQIGFLVVLTVLALWIIPNFVSFVAEKIYVLIEEHPLSILIILAFPTSIVLWIVYLRYRLYKEAMVRQFELAKMKMEYPGLIGERESLKWLPEEVITGRIEEDKDTSPKEKNS